MTFSHRVGYGYFYLLAVVALLSPGISVTVRRLHDRNRSGWWWWIFLIPLVGAIVLLVWFVQKGDEGANRFGPDPLSKPRLRDVAAPVTG